MFLFYTWLSQINSSVMLINVVFVCVCVFLRVNTLYSFLLVSTLFWFQLCFGLIGRLVAEKVEENKEMEEKID